MAADYFPERLRVTHAERGFTIRLANPNEYAIVGDVLDNAFTSSCWITETYRAGLHRIAERAKTAHVWVAVGVDGAIAGAVLTPRPEYRSDPDFTFNILGVAPEARGHGLGRALVHHAIEIGRSYGHRRVLIHSSPQMTTAHALYKHYGFHRRIDHETFILDQGQRLHHYTLPITPIPNPPTIPRLGDEPEFPDIQTPAHIAAKEAIPVTERPDPYQWVAATKERHVDAAAVAAAGPLTLRASPLDPRSWSAISLRRLLGLSATVALRLDEQVDAAALLSASGSPVAAWKDIPAVLAGVAGAAGEALADLLPQADANRIASIDALIDNDLTSPLLDVALSPRNADPDAKSTLRRLFYARIGWFDALLATRPYLLGTHITEPDLRLFGVTVTFDIAYRAHFPFADASITDYPHLWRHARALYHTPGVIEDPEKRILGLLPLPSGDYADLLGPPAPLEFVPDLRTAWNNAADVTEDGTTVTPK